MRYQGRAIDTRKCSYCDQQDPETTYHGDEAEQYLRALLGIFLEVTATVVLIPNTSRYVCLIDTRWHAELTLRLVDGRHQINKSSLPRF